MHNIVGLLGERQGSAGRNRPVSLLSCYCNGGSLDSTVLDTLGILRAVFDGVGRISIGTTEGASVGPQHWACHFAIGILQIVRSVKTFALSIITAKHAHLKNDKIIAF